MGEIFEQRPPQEIPSKNAGMPSGPGNGMRHRLASLFNGEKSSLETIQSIIQKHIADPSFRMRICPQNPDALTSQSIEIALSRLCSAESSLGQQERMALFIQTLEYYAQPSKEKHPVWHSTGSFALRNILANGMSASGGAMTGEAATTQGGSLQRGVSISYPHFPYAEHHQQMFARMNVRHDDIKSFLSVDSEKLTNTSLPKSYAEVYLRYVPIDVLKGKIAYDNGVEPSEVTEEMVTTLVKTFVHDFENREYLPKPDWAQINPLLRQDLEEEANHPFPVYLTIEADTLRDRMDKRSPYEYIPFEDRIAGDIGTEFLREIRVPYTQIPKVQQWLTKEHITHIRVVPLEVFEIKRLIEDSVLSS